MTAYRVPLALLVQPEPMVRTVRTVLMASTVSRELLECPERTGTAVTMAFQALPVLPVKMGPMALTGSMERMERLVQTGLMEPMG